LRIANLYCAPGVTKRMSRDHQPLPSLESLWLEVLQLLKEPTTDTSAAFGAQVRKVTPCSEPDE